MIVVKFRGLNMGDDSDFIVKRITGWDSIPETFNGSVARSQRNGSVAGRLGATKRVVTMDLLIPGVLADGNVNTRPRNQLRNLYSEGPQEFPLYVDLGYGNPPELIYARVTNLTMDHEPGYGQMQRALIEFTATDPLRYAAEPETSQAQALAFTQGFSNPVTYGASMESFSAQGAMATTTATNGGTAPADAVFVVHGSSITVTAQDGSAKSVHFPIAGPITIDTRLGIALSNGRDISHLAMGSLIGELHLMPGTSTITAEGGVQVTWYAANV